MNDATCPRIILDAAALHDGFVPADLCSRHPAAELLRRHLEAAGLDRQTPCCWLHGPSGSGKTALATACLEHLKQQAAIPFVTVNGWERDSLYGILDHLITQLRILRAEEHSVSAKLQSLRQYLQRSRLMVLLDEIDKVPLGERCRAIYNLSSLGNVGLVCISQDLTALHYLEDRVRSRLNPQVIAFGRYSKPQLVEILTDRVRRALAEQACSAWIVQRMADLADGDARIGIQTLRRAAETAEHAKRERILPSDITSAWQDFQDTRRNRLLANLTEDHRTLLAIAADQRAILSTELWECYRQQCSRNGRRPIAPRTFSDYVNELVRLGLLSCERARVKGNVRLLKSHENRLC